MVVMKDNVYKNKKLLQQVFKKLRKENVDILDIQNQEGIVITFEEPLMRCRQYSRDLTECKIRALDG